MNSNEQEQEGSDLKMTTIVRSGDALFPEPPRVSISLPDDWEPLVNPEVVVAGGVSEWTGFRPNVTVTTQRVAGAVAIEDIGREVWEKFEQSDEFAGNGHGLLDAFGGRASYGMEGGFQMPEAGPIYQVCVLTVIPHGEVSDIVYAVGSADAAKAVELVPVIRTVIESALILD